MVEVTQLADMAEAGQDSTAIKVGGDWWVYLGGNNQRVVRYRPDREVSSVDHTATFEPINGKVIKPERDSDVAYALPRTNNAAVNRREVVKCDPVNATYTVVDTHDFGLHNYQAVPFDGDLYFWGGDRVDSDGNFQETRTDMWTFDTATESISKVGDLSTAFKQATAGVVTLQDEITPRVIQAGGGSPGTSYHNEVYEIDVDSATQSLVGTMTDPDGNTVGFDRAFGGGVEDRLYAVGGRTSSTDYSTEVREINPTTADVTVAGNMSNGLVNAIAGQESGQLLAFGGNSGGSLQKTAFRISVVLLDRVLMVQSDLGIRLVDVSQGDGVVVHDSDSGRGERDVEVGDDVAVLKDGDLAQG